MDPKRYIWELSFQQEQHLVTCVLGYLSEPIALDDQPKIIEHQHSKRHCQIISLDSVIPGSRLVMIVMRPLLSTKKSLPMECSGYLTWPGKSIAYAPDRKDRDNCALEVIDLDLALWDWIGMHQMLTEDQAEKFRNSRTSKLVQDSGSMLVWQEDEQTMFNAIYKNARGADYDAFNCLSRLNRYATNINEIKKISMNAGANICNLLHRRSYRLGQYTSDASSDEYLIGHLLDHVLGMCACDSNVSIEGLKKRQAHAQKAGLTRSAIMKRLIQEDHDRDNQITDLCRLPIAFIAKPAEVELEPTTAIPDVPVLDLDPASAIEMVWYAIVVVKEALIG
jgi:hypothetical protein